MRTCRSVVFCRRTSPPWRARLPCAGRAIALLPTYLVSADLLEGKLVRVLPDHEPEVLGIHAIYLSRQHQPQLLRLMLDHLADRFRAEIAPLDHKLGFDRASRGRARDEG